MALTKEEIIELWRDPNFMGSFAGADMMRSHLLLDKGIRISRKKILSALQEIPEYR